MRHSIGLQHSTSGLPRRSVRHCRVEQVDDICWPSRVMASGRETLSPGAVVRDQLGAASISDFGLGMTRRCPRRPGSSLRIRLPLGLARRAADLSRSTARAGMYAA